jgi:environmental stress-induced protein Ves
VALHRFDIAALAAAPWKNGGGSTREVLCWPPGSDLDHFDWRVSIATIAKDGPFSVFAGVDRRIMLLRGAGVQLAGEGVRHHLDTPFEPLTFSGDLALQCALLGGESTDFNLMTRRARGRADLNVWRQAGEWVARHGLLLALRGRWQVNLSHGTRTLADGEGLWWADEPLTARCTPEGAAARLAAVRWQPIFKAK